MQKIPEWAVVWKELAGLNHRWRETGEEQGDHWGGKARSFSDGVRKRWARSDSSRNFLVSRLCAIPGATLLDIGAGVGWWSILAAQHAAAVTAIDHSPSMLAVMRENLDAAGVANVRILDGSWPDVDVEAHDFSLCSHAMYGAADLPRFIRKMAASTRRTCFLLMRAPDLDGLMAEFARMVLGHPHDSPNFYIAYNVLSEMGIYANVLFEDTGLWHGWTNASLDEALADVKRRLGLQENPAYDAAIYRRLEQALTLDDGKYAWPASIRSALVYWDVA